ncbi:hypothetical protein A1QO_04245 [Vibrio genomosp. F10 str. ZF-129]|uniref:Methyltransferase n=1 Tax=Vibrio genomosp. F10 str. ZF-129 TaxID=1187848 RepID=A0A1E5BIU3_9VIBR|nr:site-specific DNA-methyltransferase [Vibrio genomosp. F10]OEE37323.1 hypothetical protein A1QO_04245 [Vibrio genomosp. F10 str. ZF-129]
MQLELFEAVREVYEESKSNVSQGQLYSEVARKLGVNPNDHVKKVGKSQASHNLFHRKIRWCQMALKQQKLIENVSKGTWRLTGKEKEKITVIEQGKSILAMSTKLGIAICAKAETVFNEGIIKEDINLVLTSLPYPLQNPRLYGGPSDEKQWVDFIMTVLEPIIKRLGEGASMLLNIGQDCFLEGLCAKKLHIERLTIALVDAGLFLVDRIAWASNKIPSPYFYACKIKKLLLAGYEPCLWLTNNPKALRSDNQRVLLPHSEKHKKYVARGGVKKASHSGDGAHIKSQGDFGTLSKGKIPTNVVYIPNKCKDNEMVNAYADALGIVRHGAKFPTNLARFFIKLLSREGDFVVDPMAGTLNVGHAAEELNRKWVNIDMVWDYVRQGFIRFEKYDAYYNPAFLNPPLIRAA